MANEAVLMVETELPISFKVDNATGIEKGSFLKLTESMKAIIHSGSNDKCAGISAEEKIANDGKVTIPVYMGGIFKVVGGASSLIGAALMLSATANKIITATTGTGASGIGYALEAPSGDNQTFLMRLQIGGSVS